MQRRILSRSVLKLQKHSPDSPPKPQSSYTLHKPNLILRSFHHKQQPSHPELKDKEAINMELIHNKNLYHKVVEENRKLKTKVLGLEKEVGELREIIFEAGPKETQGQEYTPMGPAKCSKDLVKMKQILKQEKHKFQKAHESLEALKRSLKATKINTLQSQLSKYSTQATRLKSLISMEKQESKQEAKTKTEPLKKCIKQLERHNKQLLRDNQDYKYRIKCSLNLIEKVVGEAKKELKMEHLKRVRVMLDVNVEKNKENEVRRIKRVAYKNQQQVGGGGEEKKNLAHNRSVQRIQFASLDPLCPTPTNTKNPQQNPTNIPIPLSDPKKPLNIIQQKSTQQFATMIISINHPSPAPQTHPSPHVHQHFGDSSKYSPSSTPLDQSIYSSHSEEFQRTSNNSMQNQASNL